MMRPEKGANKNTALTKATGGGNIVLGDKWRSAGDAIIAAQRLLKTETQVYKPDERRVTIQEKEKEIKASKEKAAKIEEQRALIKAGIAGHTAAKIGDANTLHRLIQANPAVARYQDENKVTPLLYASAYGRQSCTELLCGAGADVNHVNVWGSTPLINAAHNAHVTVVHFLILNDAMVTWRDKDGTPLDSALKRMVRMIRGVSQATDDKHPDKPGLEEGSKSLTSLNQQTNRGPLWHKNLEAAFVPLRPLLSQAENAAATLNYGKVDAPGAGPPALPAPKDEERPGSSASKSSKGSKGSKGSKSGKEKKDDEPEGPDEGRCALYNGLAAYMRCIEMLRDPAKTRQDEKLRTGGDPTEKKVDGLSQKVGRIRKALALDVSLPIPEVLKQANLAMGFDLDGNLLEQTERMITALGLE